MRIDMAHDWGMCSTLIIHQLPIPTITGICKELRKAIDEAEAPKSERLCLEYRSRGTEKEKPYVNRICQTLLSYKVKSFAFMIATVLTLTPNEQRVWEDMGFKVTEKVWNSKNQTFVHLLWAPIRDVLDQLEYWEAHNYGLKP